MTDLHMPTDLAEEIRREAEAEGVTAEALLADAWRHYRTAAQRKKIQAEMEWWQNLPDNQRAQYAGEYIAVHGRQVVDHDADRVRLHQRIRERYGHTAVLIIPADGPREIRILSPRLERG